VSYGLFNVLQEDIQNKGRMSRIISTSSMKGAEKQVTFSEDMEEIHDSPEDKRVRWITLGMIHVTMFCHHGVNLILVLRVCNESKIQRSTKYDVWLHITLK